MSCPLLVLGGCPLFMVFLKHYSYGDISASASVSYKVGGARYWECHANGGFKVGGACYWECHANGG